MAGDICLWRCFYWRLLLPEHHRTAQSRIQEAVGIWSGRHHIWVVFFRRWWDCWVQSGPHKWSWKMPTTPVEFSNGFSLLVSAKKLTSWTSKNCKFSWLYLKNERVVEAGGVVCKKYNFQERYTLWQIIYVDDKEQGSQNRPLWNSGCNITGFRNGAAGKPHLLFSTTEIWLEPCECISLDSISTEFLK